MSKNAYAVNLTEIFLESAELNFDDLVPAIFFLRYPKGTYKIEGKTIESLELESEVELTLTLHKISELKAYRASIVAFSRWLSGLSLVTLSEI